jgi:hypothetical protein
LKKLCLTLSFMALALALVACGGNSSDAERVAALIERVVSDREPADCRELETQRYLEQTNRSSGMTPLEYCESSARLGTGETVEVSGVSIDGSRATARATYVTGSLSPATLLLELRADGEAWKLDRVVRFVDFDKQEVVETLEEGLVEALGDAPPKYIACVSSRLARVPAKELEETLLSSPKLKPVLLARLDPCTLPVP